MCVTSVHEVELAKIAHGRLEVEFPRV